MTRQKKELIRKITEIENFIRVDEELGCGFAPAGFYDPLYEKIYALQEELARLSHYECFAAMATDDRWVYGPVDLELPFD